MRLNAGSDTHLFEFGQSPSEIGVIMYKKRTIKSVYDWLKLKDGTCPRYRLIALPIGFFGPDRAANLTKLAMWSTIISISVDLKPVQ